MLFGFRKARGDGAQFHGQCEARRGDEGEMDDAETAHFEKALQRWHRACPAIGDIHPIVGDKIKTARKQSEHQIGLARAWWPDQQHAIAITAGAAPVDLRQMGAQSGLIRGGKEVACRLAGGVRASPPP